MRCRYKTLGNHCHHRDNSDYRVTKTGKNRASKRCSKEFCPRDYDKEHEKDEKD